MSEKKLRIAVLLSGRGSNFEALAGTIQRASLPVEIALVASDKADARGLELARARGLKTAAVTRRAKERTAADFFTELADTVASCQPDLVVLAGFMRVLDAAFIRRFAGKIINIHPSLLPAFKGLHAPQQAWEAQVRFAGCTVHYVAEEVDAGPIIGQAVVPCFPCDTADDLSARILEQEHQLLPAAVAAIARGDVWLAEKDGRALVMFKSKPCELSSTDNLFSLKKV